VPSDHPAHPPARHCAILAGGAASRLGGRKATALLAGVSLSDHVAAAARTAGLTPVVVAKAGTALDGIGAEALFEPAEPRHPLVGVATALARLGEPVVCCPCDLPLVPAALLAALASYPAEICVAAHGGRLQPLLGRYEPSAAAGLLAAAQGGRAVTETVLAAGARELDLDDLGLEIEPSWALANANDSRDLERLEAYLGGTEVPREPGEGS
jgi:molybdopterin-guanine dinucleotide biosynthesis protein A